jgi:lipoprotein-anchoring transpeptidase ErfK/SrfK
MNRGIIRLLLPLIGFIPFLTSCGPSVDTGNKMIVSVRDQKMLLVHNGEPIKTYKISTSKFGLGDQPGSNRTPLGRMKVAKKIGSGSPPGAVFKSRRPTGEVLKPNAPGRDPIVSRILWLAGTDSNNRNAFRRFIYIHGTPEMSRLGTPASYGCIRMGCRDVVDLYDRVGQGADVYVVRGSLPPSVAPKTNNMVIR